MPSGGHATRAILRSPLTWILLGSVVVHGVGIGWGLPASDGWDNDGVAPRDILPGIAATFTPGSFYTYPPVHLLLLAVLTLPASLLAVLRAPSFALADVVHEMLKVGYMTAMAGVARVVSLAMSLGIALHVARLVEELRADELGVAPSISAGGYRTLTSSFDAPPVRRLGWCAAAFVGANASLTYYAHTSNLDVPYLFWATWSALVFVRALVRRAPRLLRGALVLAALAVGTKDQASALFVLSFPVALGIWLVGAPSPEIRRRAIGEAVRAAGLAALTLALVDGALVNPSGFRARLGFLLGSASQDYVEYTGDWWGRLGLLVDAGRTFPMQYPSAFGAAILFGIASSVLVALRAPPGERARRLASRSVALLVAGSFTLMFNFSARRADPRFLLPQAVFLAVYGAFALEALVFSRRRVVRIAGRVVAIAGFAFAVHTCISLDANLLYDPRYEAEAWLAAHVQPGEVIETYGQNVYMPRMPAGAHVIRVGPEPIDKRNPMPGIEEVQAPFEAAESRPTKWIVLSSAWAWRYIIKIPPHVGAGRQLPPNHARTLSESPAAQFFDRLVGGVSPFGYAHVCEYSARLFPVVDVHGTTGRTIWIYERNTAVTPSR